MCTILKICPWEEDIRTILSASDNWSRIRLARPRIFRELLLKGVEQGALSSGNRLAWRWIKIAAHENDPAEFMDDHQHFCDLLCAAVEAGNEIAREILDAHPILGFSIF